MYHTIMREGSDTTEQQWYREVYVWIVECI